MQTNQNNFAMIINRSLTLNHVLYVKTFSKIYLGLLIFKLHAVNSIINYMNYESWNDRACMQYVKYMFEFIKKLNNEYTNA